tara:strand:+ start:1209 stop:1829 length:621 start_codon:yes stop_codon:yes gene_type:complete
MKKLIVTLTAILTSFNAFSVTMQYYQEREAANTTKDQLFYSKKEFTRHKGDVNQPNSIQVSYFNVNDGMSVAEPVQIPPLTIKGRSLIKFDLQHPTDAYADTDAYKILLMPGEYFINVKSNITDGYYINTHIVKENSDKPIWQANSFGNTKKVKSKFTITQMGIYYIFAVGNFDTHAHFKKTGNINAVLSAPQILDYSIKIEKNGE